MKSLFIYFRSAGIFLYFVSAFTTSSLASSSPTYIGCFTDDSSRALPDQLMNDGATVENCVAAGAAAGYAFAGVQYGGQCFAGNVFGYSLTNDSDCNMPCAANPADTCGGYWRNSIYSTGASGSTIASPSSTTFSTSSCQMTVPSCPNYPSTAGTFNDNYQDPGYSVPSGSNQSECVQRAADYYNWCGASTPVTSSYIVNGSAVQSTTYPANATSCQVTVPSCPNYPSTTGTFNDNYQDPGYSVPSGSNQSECMQRASDYYDWCGASTPVTTSYSMSGSVVQSTTYPANSSPPTPTPTPSPSSSPNPPGSCGPDSAPAPAAARGLNCEVMDIDFSLNGGLSATDPANGNKLIDTGNTLQPGFDLYINNNFPGQYNNPSDIQFPHFGVTPSDAYSVLNGNLVVAPTVSDTGIIGNQWLFNTIGYNGFAGSWVGHAFTGSYYIEVNLVSFTLGGAPTPTFEPIVWMFAAQALTASPIAPVNGYVELDMVEPQYSGRFIHEWGANGDEILSGGQATTTLPITNGNTYGTLLLQPSDNSGTGLIQPYLNDAYDNSAFPAPQMEVAPTIQPQPEPASGLPVGTYSQVYSTPEAVMIDSNIGSTLVIKSIRVYCANPNSC